MPDSDVVRVALACGFDDCGSLPVAEIVLSDEVREICRSNGCRLYGTSWACPPAVGTLAECGARLRLYQTGYVFRKTSQLEDSFDLDGMRCAHGEFKALCDRFDDRLRSEYPQRLLLSNEGCSRCERCTWPDASCRFPDRLFPSLEGYGIYVYDLARHAKLSIPHEPATVTYYGMLCLP